jgi:hypothetical protein
VALCGEGAVCIWNDIADEGRDAFYAWHLAEHMPERVGIPGFRRGRRYVACDGDTAPEFFTLYETDTPEVLVGQDYLNRLNNPTAWTKRATQAFRNTSRALTRVHASYGPGSGGILATIRFAAAAGQEERLRQALKADVLPSVAEQHQIAGAHLCLTNADASAARTAESRDRTDIQAAPDWVVLIEGCNPEPVRAAAEQGLRHPGFAAAEGTVVGLYRLEYTRLKTAHAPG